MDTTSPLPLVTLGMPVYNEAAFIAESLENVLKQSYPNLEIIISDNGSTDGTSEICAEYARTYPQIKHVRHLKNMGQHVNFNYLVQCASGKYFSWVAGHDLLHPLFVEHSVAALEANQGAVLAFHHTIYMTIDGKEKGERKRAFDISTMPAARRFKEVMWRVDCNYVYGMFRTAAMRESKLFQAVPAADRVFLAEMAIKGTFLLTDAIKYSRLNREPGQPEMEKRHRLMSYLYPDRTFTDAELSGHRLYAPTYRSFKRAVQDASFPWPTRLLLYESIWMSGVMKAHLFPGADLLSRLVKAILPTAVQQKIMKRMQ